ncbi:acyl-CoA dehydrogenase family protein [Mycolicibacterium sp. YH-1]|uniref:acyl-CoA dehydrogenase family protein n=1 Tax=Mycolicibacterium sp. YH-1 TaxID=2908837 RepID=UPI001F4BF055|nr:acyl-CoA dehydrogenase family protein [Mycolicibacterium sp. YH-1]UNB54514.1 acyl-CoA dehydrogenase family protein [Mycolicibacterium sp. YH-1]
MDIKTETTSIADDMIAQITHAAEEIEAQADENERIGKLNETTLGVLKRIGLLDAMAPAEYGGADLTIYDVLRVFEALSYVDASTGWVAMIPGVQGKGLLLLDTETRGKLAVGGYPFVSGQGAPTGRAKVVDGGYLVSGRWSYGSGFHHCDIATGVALVVGDSGPILDENGLPDAVLFYTPSANATIEGNWGVLGMRATGSVDYSLADVFVPENQVARAPFATTLGGNGQAKLLGFTGWVMSVHCAAPLGVGRRLLDELALFARQPSSRGVRLADDPRFAYGYGKAEAAYRSAHAFMFAAFGNAQERMNRGEPATRRDLTDMRAASVLVHDVNVDNATFALRECGGTTLRNGLLQRLYRDIMAMGQHVQASQSTWAEVAKDYLGDADDMQWQLNKLVS